jgi:hypothetical protein
LSARARLIKTRRGTWVDKGLFPEARHECLEIIERVARDSKNDGIVEMLWGERKRLADYPLGQRLRERETRLSDYYGWMGMDRWGRNWTALEFVAEKLREYELPEEQEAWIRAIEAPELAKTCGSCGRSLRPGEAVYFGAEVYVGFPPLRWSVTHAPRVCQPRYQRTVLCGSCAPDWLSEDREGVVAQLCSHCERPMVYLLAPSQVGRTFCSDPCGRTYHSQLHNRLRNERGAEEREKVCETCGERFTATRRDQKNCSTACKQKAYRYRKKQAKQGR